MCGQQICVSVGGGGGGSHIRTTECSTGVFKSSATELPSANVKF